MLDALGASPENLSSYEEALFSRLNLGQHMELVLAIAIDEFERKKTDGSNYALIERLWDEHRLEPLNLSSGVERVDSFVTAHGEIRHLFALEFCGSPRLWNMSPDPIEPRLPVVPGLMFVQVSCSARGQRPVGGVLGNRLILISSSPAAPISAIAEIRSLIDQQAEILANFADELRAELGKRAAK